MDILQATGYAHGKYHPQIQNHWALELQIAIQKYFPENKKKMTTLKLQSKKNQ